MEALLDVLARLVAVDTTSRRSNLPLIELVEQLVAPHASAVERVTAGDKAGLLVRFGPNTPGGVVLSAHSDCVPVDDQAWSSDPFDTVVADGRVYGRGTADMKGFIASCVAAAPMLGRSDLVRPVVLALSHDEELGTLGAPALVDALAAFVATPAGVIVGEPTSMEVVNAHKGVRSFTTTVTGAAGHSSQPDLAANAVVAAARIAAFLADLADDLASGHPDPAFDPPWTTVNVATISGGTAINIVPRTCRLTWEYRPVPADDSFLIRDRVEAFVEAHVLPWLWATAADASVETVSDAVVPTLQPEPEPAAEALARAWTHDDGPARSVAFGTDGGHFQRAGLSTVVCGPGSIEQAHRPDEWVSLDQLARCARFIEQASQWAAGS